MHCNIIGHHEKECKKKQAPKNASNQTTGKSVDQSAWQEVQNRRNGRGKKNNASNQGSHEGNAGGVEKITQLEANVARTEAMYRAASAELEKTKQAAVDELASAKRTELERTSASVPESEHSVELARTRQNESDRNVDNTSSTPLQIIQHEASHAPLQEVPATSPTPLYNVVSETEVVI
ncbi:hypothetical protein MKX03_029260 [Papaver bracteatum]|nr:hypothetical protein MKX03_029260 [Papaver bracteatum]